MEEQITYYEEILSCSCPDYSLELQTLQEQVNALNDNIVILSDVQKGGNSILLWILVLLFIACIYKLLRFVF